MYPASLRSSSNPYSAFPATHLTLVADPNAQANSTAPIAAHSFFIPPFIDPKTTRKFDDFFQNGIVPEDKTVQQKIARALTTNNDAVGLSEFLEKSSMEVLDLKACGLGEIHASVLASVLKTEKSLREINLHDNKIESEGLKIICEALKESTTLVSLDLGSNEASDPEHVDAIANLIENNKTLKKLKLQYCNISDDGMRILADALKKNHTLTELNLSFNHCGQKGVEALLRMMSENDTLEILDLSGNAAERESGSLVADLLETNTTLRELKLDNNYLDSEGAIPIFNALTRNTTLQHLHLAHNNLNSASAEHIGFMLQENIGLSSLDLCGNRLFVPSDNGIMEAIDLVAQGLENNTMVIELNLKKNHPIDKFMMEKPVMGDVREQQRDNDLARINDLLKRNETFEALMAKDASLCTGLSHDHLLSLDEGKLLAGAMIMAARSTAAYESTMVEIQCAINVLASQT